MDPLSIGIYTWFMSLENYNELRFQGSTDLLVPLLPEPYKLDVYVMAYKQWSEVQCTLQRPYVASPVPLKMPHTFPRAKFQVVSAPEKSGTYTVSCLSKYFYPPEDAWYPIKVEKDITLRFEKGLCACCMSLHDCVYNHLLSLSVPLIELVGHTGNTIVIPHTNKTLEFYVNVYSTSDINTFHIARSDGVGSKVETQISIELLSHPYYLLLAKYRVSLSWLDDSVTGSYTIRIRNKKGETSTLPFRLRKLKGE